MGRPAMIPVVAAIAAVLALVGLIAWALSRAHDRRIRTTRLLLLVPGLPEPLQSLRIAYASDLHAGMLYVTREELLAAVDAADPDLLLLGGDYAAAGRNREEALSLLAALAVQRPTFGVPGNTEHYFRFDFGEIDEVLATGGGGLLVNEVRDIEIDGATLELIGLDDPEKGHLDVTAALAGASEGAAVRIALAHSPAIWPELGRVGAHLMLCGHTHGGQIRPPGLEAPLTHMSYPARLAAGLFRHAPGQRPTMQRLAGHWWILSHRRPISASTAPGPLMYVSRGVGVGIIPVRFLCPPELVVIELAAGRPPREATSGDE